MSFSDDESILTSPTSKTFHHSSFTMTTRKRVGAAAVAALLLASEATAFAPPPSATIAVASPSRFVRGGCALRGDSTSSPPPSPALAGRDGRSSRSTYAPYSIGDGRVGVGGEVGRPPPAAGVGGGGVAVPVELVLFAGEELEGGEGAVVRRDVVQGCSWNLQTA